MSIGLYIGRFQPFHLGHLSAVKQALKHVDRLYIAIGSSQYSKEPRNPFSATERQEMIELTLKEAGLQDRCEIFQVPDIHDRERWADHVKNIIPEFNVVFVGDEGIVKKLFEKSGTTVKIIKKEVDISATAIREGTMKNEKHQKYLSKTVLDYLRRRDT